MNFEYKVVPLPILKNTYNIRSKLQDRIAKLVESALETEALNGWEFVKLESVKVSLKGLFFKQFVEKEQTVIIYRRQRKLDVNNLGHVNRPTNIDTLQNPPKIGSAYRD